MTPTSAQIKAGQAMVMVVAETVRECRECPSGTIYAGLMGRVSLAGYEKILTILKNAGLIEVGPCHLIKWIGQN